MKSKLSLDSWAWLVFPLWRKSPSSLLPSSYSCSKSGLTLAIRFFGVPRWSLSPCSSESDSKSCISGPSSSSSNNCYGWLIFGAEPARLTVLEEITIKIMEEHSNEKVKIAMTMKQEIKCKYHFLQIPVKSISVLLLIQIFDILPLFFDSLILCNTSLSKLQRDFTWLKLTISNNKVTTTINNGFKGASDPNA